MEIVQGYRPGWLSGLIRLHMDYYGREWGFGAGFEALIGKEAGAFLDRYDERRDLMLTVWKGRTMRGSLVIDGGKPLRGHLRWFMVDKTLRGQGVGTELMDRAMGFVDQHGLVNTYLTTFTGLDAAAALYRKHGFVCVSSPPDDRWQGGVREEMWERPRLRRAQAS